MRVLLVAPPLILSLSPHSLLSKYHQRYGVPNPMIITYPWIIAMPSMTPSFFLRITVMSSAHPLSLSLTLAPTSIFEILPMTVPSLTRTLWSTHLLLLQFKLPLLTSFVHIGAVSTQLVSASISLTSSFVSTQVAPPLYVVGHPTMALMKGR